MTIATIDISFTRILSEGPAVSLNGSPTVSHAKQKEGK